MFSDFITWFGGDHPPGEMFFWISQVVLAVGATFAAVVAYKQVKAFGALELVKFMQQDHVRKARTHVRRVLANKPLTEWTDEDKFEASTVCSSFDLMGFLLQKKLAPQKAYIQLYAATIQLMHSHLAAFLTQERDLSQNGPSHWQHFTWLEQKARRLSPPSQLPQSN